MRFCSVPVRDRYRDVLIAGRRYRSSKIDGKLNTRPHSALPSLVLQDSTRGRWLKAAEELFEGDFNGGGSGGYGGHGDFLERMAGEGIGLLATWIEQPDVGDSDRGVFFELFQDFAHLVAP